MVCDKMKKWALLQFTKNHEHYELGYYKGSVKGFSSKSIPFYTISMCSIRKFYNNFS